MENEIPLSTMQSPADESRADNQVSGSYTNLFRTSVDAEDEEGLTGRQESGGVHVENVYSNIPTSPEEDPTMHVYSNVGTGNDLSFDTNNSLLVASSTLLADDLDLDDPATAASAYRGDQVATKVSTKTPSKSGGHEESAKIATTKNGDVGRSGQKSSGQTAIEMKNVIPSVADSVHTGAGNSSTNRLRMLHDTTMIDTALDLDSLDGSSLGNNSSACLVKTAAIV